MYHWETQADICVNLCVCSQEDLLMTLGDLIFTEWWKTSPSVCVWRWFMQHSRSFDLRHSSRWYSEVCRCGCEHWAQTTGSCVCFSPPLGSVSVWIVHQQSGKWAFMVQSLDRHWQIQSWSNEQISTSKAGETGWNVTHLKMEHYSYVPWTVQIRGNTL